MVMPQYVALKGIIRAGKLDVQLPANVIDGEAELLVPVESKQDEDEFAEMLHFEGKTLGEILDSGLTGLGAEAMKDLPDSVEYVEILRERMRRERAW